MCEMDLLARIRAKARYAKQLCGYRLRSTFWSVRNLVTTLPARRLYDVERTYWVNPARIRMAAGERAPDRLNPAWRAPVPPWIDKGKIVSGDWDLGLIPFEELDVWEAFEDRFVRGRPWQETSFYRRVLRIIEGGIPLWSCRTRERLDARMVELDKVFGDIKANGYRTQRELNELNPYGYEDEVQVHIGRDGDYIFADGRHRLCIAKILQLDRIPVKVLRRHALWVALRREILAYLQ